MRAYGSNKRVGSFMRIGSVAVPYGINPAWYIDFMYDLLQETRSFQLFDVIDIHKREVLGREVKFPLPLDRVMRALNQILEWRGKFEAIRCDNGPENVSGKLIRWAQQNSIRREYNQPDKPR